MRTLLLLLLVSLANLGFAQDGAINNAQGNESYHQFKEGDVSYLLADNVNVRSSASTKGTIVANLPIGTKVEILAVSNQKLRLNGFETNWYGVEFTVNNKVKTGYVWGGLIAEGTIAAAEDSKVLFLYGVASVKTEDKEAYYSEKGVFQLRACRDNKELSKIEIKSASNNLNIYHWLANYGNKGLSTIQDVIELGESAESCGGTNAQHIIFWDGKELLNATKLSPGSDAPYFFTDDLIFPSDKGGKKDKIIRDEQDGWSDEAKEEDVIERHKRVEYVWTGKTLKQTKVLIDKTYDVEE